MSHINYILGNDSITVFLDGNSYTINKQAHTYPMVFDAVKSESTDKLRATLNIRQGINKTFTKLGGSNVRIDDNRIYYREYEVTGLVASRVFEMLRLGLSIKPMVNFIENLMENPAKRAVDELFGFIEACRLPITADGHFLAYKRVRDDYTDCHSGTMDNSVGSVLSMPRNAVDEDKNRTCSAGLHFCSYDYLQHFGGERIMVLKINPRDVVAIPVDYNNAKGRTCRYEVVDELPLNSYKMPETPIVNDYTDQYVDSSFDDGDDGDGYDDFGEDDTDDYNYNDSMTDFLAGAQTWGVFDNGDPVDTVADDGPSSDHVTDVNTTGKLTPTEVLEIRKLLATYSLAALARKFGVSSRTIARIRDGESWVNV